MTPLLAALPELPLGKSGKFVAGAYIVVLVLILTYVAIMAVRAQRLERELAQLQHDVEAARDHAQHDLEALAEPVASALPASERGQG